MIRPYYRNERLDRRCRELRVTGSLLAYNTGISEYRLSKIRTGRLEPKAHEKQLIADKLDCKPEQIFPG